MLVFGVRRETYVEGVAIHSGPEPCADACKGAGEASAGECAGQPLSRERPVILGADTVPNVRGYTHGSVVSECPDDPGTFGSNLAVHVTDTHLFFETALTLRDIWQNLFDANSVWQGFINHIDGTFKAHKRDGTVISGHCVVGLWVADPASRASRSPNEACASTNARL